MTTRRRFLAGVGGAAVTGLAGCSGSGGTATPAGDVRAGPDGRTVFDPEEITVSAGDTVVWAFVSPNHNVSAVPGHAPQASVPDGADPFASYGVDGDPNRTAAAGTTYEHTFETPGEYTYVCIPHARQGMVGTIVVEE
ncbi:MAG: plastocyanin/azurin family copper-binding protein [Haloarculaceae archaeon]